MSNDRARRYQQAMSYLEQGLASEAMRIGKELENSSDSSDRLSGYMCQGWVYEEGGVDFPPNVERAIYNYRQAALIEENSIIFCYLARASMKLGPQGYEGAYKYLLEAAKLKLTPDVLLGFAWYYRTKPQKDLKASKKFYVRAALRGRFMGFFGYSQVSREMGQPLRALVADCLRLFVAPVLVLAVGSRARDRF